MIATSRAAQYYNQALFWVLGTSTPDEEENVYVAMDDAWRESAKRQSPKWEPFTFPWNGRRLPAWFLRPAGANGRRRTLIMNNGSDGQNVDMLPQGASFALERGWNVVIFEGPGQGRTLFVDRIPFTPDWHEVITPLVDVLHKRSDVEPKQIALLGVSFAGLLVMRPRRRSTDSPRSSAIRAASATSTRSLRRCETSPPVPTRRR